ncbi:uncharacterized protein [Venturia canescens]|uniref:uncharacterized protein n=1 Tax=Venturia canescens TaxID=32260 RepID=UPI001C9D5528|nr:uncharacterized protein LOC122405947 [Venturia canescens]
MLPTKFSFWGHFPIILVWWLTVNDAIPYGVNKKPTHPYAFEGLQGPDLQDLSTDETSDSKADDWPDELLEHTTDVNNTNFNVNVNSFHSVKNKTRLFGKPPTIQTDQEIRGKNERTSNTKSVIDHNDTSVYCLDQHSLQSNEDEAVFYKCSIRQPGNDQVHGQHVSRNGPAIDVEDTFKVTGERKAKKTSNIYTGEDITLCWIELTTIKEDSASIPPKKLVIREFTISFENADTIPEKDMDCSRIRGEILPGEEKIICESDLDDIIVDDTKRSRVVESFRHNRNDSIKVRQYKKIKCATGNVVSKYIYEWPDNTDSPRKRVEIKVGPSVQNVRSGKDGRSSLCKPKAVATDSREGMTTAPADECSFEGACEINASCEDTNTCNKSDESCKNGACTSTSVPKKILTTTDIPNYSDETLHPPDTLVDNNCLDNDNCTIEQATIEPDKLATKSIENCSQDDCTAQPFDDTETVKDCSQGECSVETTSHEAVDSRTNKPASLCTEDDCISEKEVITAKDETSIKGIKACQEGIESCDCSASSCSGDATEDPNFLEFENHVTEESATPSEKGITEIPDNHTKCDSRFMECLNSSMTTLNDKQTTPATTVSKNTEKRVESTINDELMSPLPDQVVTTTSSTEKIATLSTLFSTADATSSKIPLTSAVPLCLDPTSKDCVTAATMTPSKGTDESTPGKQEYSSSTKENTKFSVTEENPIAGTETFEFEEDSSCQQNLTGKNCRSTEPNSPIGMQVDNETSLFLPVSTSKTVLTFSEESKDSTNPGDFTFTPMPMMSKVSEMSLTKNSGQLLKHPRMPDEKTSTQDSSIEINSESCESSESCKSTGDSPSSIGPVIDDSASGGRVDTTENCENTTCSDISEECINNITSTDGSSDCEDGSLSGNCSGNDSLEEIDSNGNKTITLTTEPSLLNVEPILTTFSNVSSTAETRRTTIQSKPEDDKKHKLVLKIKVLLEHINEKEEKEKLVQLEKHLLLDEMLDQHGNHSLIWHLKSLNNSNNIKILKSIFNLTDLANLTEVFSHVTEFNEGGLKKASKLKTGGGKEHTSNEALSRSKRHVSPSNNVDKETNNDVTTRVKAINGSLSGLQEDFQRGIGHILGKISHEFNGSTLNAIDKKNAEASRSTIMKILAVPGNNMIHSRRQKRATKLKDVLVEELKHPVNGDEIGRWSNERFVTDGNGGRVRSLLEFEIMKNPNDDLRRIGSTL